MKLTISTADIKSVLATSMSAMAGAEQQLAADARQQVHALIDELYPLIVSETQSLLTAVNPAVPQAYLAILQGCVDAAVAKLSLNAIAAQRQVLASALQTGIQILALVLRAAVVA